MALQRATTLYFETATTVDTGGSVDIRGLDTAVVETPDFSASILNSTQGSNAERRWDPATGSSTTTQNASTTQDGKGWAIPTAGMDNGDSRCTTRIVAQNVDVFMRGTASGTGTGGVGANDVLTPRASLWKWNTSTDTATLIIGGSGTAVTISAVLAYTNTEWQTTVSLTVPATTFAANEVLLVVVGGNLACGAGLLGGARTTRWDLLTDHSAYTKITFATNGLTQRCDVAPTGTLILGSKHLLDANERSFETSAAGWVGANATLAQTAAVALDGTKSLSVTRTGGTSTAASTPKKAAVPGTVYLFEGWVRSAATTKTAQAAITFYDSGGSTIVGQAFGGFDGNGYVTTSTTSWKRVAVNMLAPAGAAFVDGSVIFYAQAGSEVHYIDQAILESNSSLVLKPMKALTASITPTSTVARSPSKFFTGTIVPASEVVRRPSRILTGAITPSSTLTRQPTRILVRNLTPGPGAIIRMPIKVLASSITPTSLVSRMPTRMFTGSITPSGAVIRRPTRLLSSALTMSGALIRRPTRILARTFTPGPSSLTRMPTKLFTSSITPTSTLNFFLRKFFTGSITPAGQALKRPTKYMESNLTPGPSTLVRQPTKLLTGNITPTSLVRSLLTKNFRSDLGLSGALVRRISKYMTGNVTPSGSLRKTPKKYFTGLISGEGGGGTVVNIFRRIFIDD